MWFLIGSQAIHTINENFYRDISHSDIDLYCSESDFKQLLSTSKNIEKCFPLKKNKYRLKITNYPIIEVKIYSEKSVYHWLSLNEQKDLLSTKKYMLDNLEMHIPNLQCLTAIKESHIYWPIHWLKNIEDLEWLRFNARPYNQKEIEFKRRIKNEMKQLHGKIPFKQSQEHDNEANWTVIIENMTIEDSYDKNMVLFIHTQLSLRQKIKVIKKWTDYQSLLQKNVCSLEL